MNGRIPGLTYAQIIRAAAAVGDFSQLPPEMANDVINGLRLAKKSQDVGSAFQGIPAYWFSRAIEVGGQETLFEPYRNSVWVQRAIKKVAGPVASVELVFMEAGSPAIKSARKARSLLVGTGKGLVKRAVEDFVDIPDLSAWLAEPAPGMGWSDFVEATVGWIKLRGEAFWVLSDEMLVPFPEARQGAMPPIIVARPDRMRHVVEDGRLVGWVLTDASGEQHTLLPEQVIQTKCWNPYNPWRGLAEYDAAQIAAEGDWLAGKFSRNISANNGDKGPIIVAKNGVPTDPQRAQIIQELKAKRAAQLRGDFKPIFLTGDISVEDPQIQTVDGDFIAQRLSSRHEIATAFGVPMSMFDVKNDYSMGSQSAYYQLILDTCIPSGAKLCDSLERLIQKVKRVRYVVGLLWDEHPVMQTVRRERIDAMGKLADRGMPMVMVSDYLHLDLPRFPGDDVGFLPMAVMPISGAEAPPDPSSDPSFSETSGEQGEDEAQSAIGAMMKVLKSPVAKAKTKKHQRWESLMRQREETVRVFKSKIGRVLMDYRARVLRKVEQYGNARKSGGAAIEGVTGKSLIDFIFDAAQFGRDLMLQINSPMHAALQTAADQLRKDELGKRDPWKFPPQKATDYVKGRTQTVQGCGQTVRDQLNTALEEGIERGESTAELSDRVRGVFNGLAKGESERIARTETGAAFGFSRDEAMKAAGVDYKSWLSSHGLHVRDAHREAEERYEAEPIPVDEPFIVGGESLMYPGDPSGSPGNIINCQCVQIAVAAPGEETDESDSTK